MTQARQIIEKGHIYEFDRTVRGFNNAASLAKDWNADPNYHAIIKYGKADGKRVYHVYYRRCFGDKHRKGNINKRSV